MPNDRAVNDALRKASIALKQGDLVSAAALAELAAAFAEQSDTKVVRLVSNAKTSRR